MSRLKSILKNKKLINAAAAIPVFAAAVYICLPTPTVKTPKNAKKLDLDRKPKGKFYLSEEDYARQMEDVVKPYLKKRGVSGYFKGYDGNRLYYESYAADKPKAHIVISHGFESGAYAFKEIIYYFLKSGYSVSVTDHRGHGYSYRSVEDISKVTVNSFDEYTKDYKIFVNDVVRPRMKDGEKLFMFAHSMGGAIAALLLEEDSEMFDAAVLESPMMEVEFGKTPDNAVMLVQNIANLIGRGDDYIIGHGSYKDTYAYASSNFDSEARYAYMHGEKSANVYYQTSGGSFAWLKNAVSCTKKIRKNAAQCVTDTLLFQAENDTAVAPGGQNDFVGKAKNTQMIIVPGTKHNIQFAENDVLLPFMDTVLEFYSQHL